LIGKRWTVRAAMLMNGLGFIIMGAAQNFWVLMVGYAMFQTGIALYSGAGEALAYDTLKEHQLEHRWDKVTAANSTASLLTLVVCSLIGIPMYAYAPHLPHLAWGVAFMVGFVLSLYLTEPNIGAEPVKFSLRAYWGQLATGARQLIKPNLLPYFPLIFALPGVFFLYSWGIIMPAVGINFGLNADGLAIFVSVVYVFVAIAVRSLPFIRRKWGDLTGLTVMSLLMIVALFGMALPLGSAGVAIMFMMHLGGAISRSWMSIVINENTPSEIRATTLSTMALIYKLPYVLVAALAGVMIEGGQVGIFTAVTGGVALILLIAGHVLAQRHRQIVELAATAGAD
jgi:MFS family permease